MRHGGHGGISIVIGLIVAAVPRPQSTWDSPSIGRPAHGWQYPRAGVRARRQEGDAISSTSLDIALAAIAAVAAAVAVWRSILAGRQAREAKKSRELSAVISLFNVHESEDALRIRRLIRRGEIGDRLDDPEIRFQLRHYIHQLNFVATLRSRQLLGDELVKDLFYEAARSCWEQCARSFVREIRATQNPDFARELQDWVGAPNP
jgi:hypothetical protein